MESRDVLKQIFTNDNHWSLPVLLDTLNSLLHCNIKTTDSVLDKLIDLEFLEQVRSVSQNVSIYFGKTLRDLKLIIQDGSYREHEVCFRYNDNKKLTVTSLSAPHTPLQDLEYNSIEEIIITFKRHLDGLISYFYELEQIDRVFAIMEPVKPNFKDDYRKIYLADRAWLHIEVTPEGSAVNMHLIGQCELWKNKLQSRLVHWDYDKEIVENIMTVFELESFPTPPSTNINRVITNDTPVVEVQECSICLCAELPDQSGVPQPLCQNPSCGVYFHRNCLYQWLVACSGGRPPAFGVASGSCPTCFQPISCSEKDA